MKAKFFVVIVVAIMMIGIAIVRSRAIHTTLPITPGAFEEVQKARPR